MARGRPKDSFSTKAVRLSDLVEYLPAGATIKVGSTWLKQFEELHNVKFSDPATPAKVSVMDDPEVLEGGDEKEAEVRERLPLQSEEL